MLICCRSIMFGLGYCQHKGLESSADLLGQRNLTWNGFFSRRYALSKRS